MSRSDHYLARVDAHLERLTTGTARRSFLAAYEEAWRDLYDTFVKTEGASGPPDATAADYVLVITGIAARLKAEVARP